MSRNLRVVVQHLLVSGNIPCAARKLLPGCNFIQPQTLTSIPSSPRSPIYRPFSSSVCVPSVRDQCRLLSKPPYESVYGNSGNLTINKIRDESLSAVCCFYALHDSIWPFATQINQSLVGRFPHVKAFHFILEDDIDVKHDITYDVTMRALGISSLPMYHFYKNGAKVEELTGDYIMRLERILEKLYYNPHELGKPAKEKEVIA